MLNLALGVGSTSLAHYNRQPQDVEVHTEGIGKFPKIDALTLYLPQNLDIDQILRENPPRFKFKRDKFVYILSLIYSIPSQKKDSIKDYNGFTPISKAILGSVIKDYRNIY